MDGVASGTLSAGAVPYPRITHFDEKVLGHISSDKDAEVLAREMLLAHQKYLPQFRDAIVQLDKN